VEPETIYTLIGYLGSALVVLSISMTSVLKLRVIGLVGAVTFLVYGVLIGAAPVVVTNIFIIGVHGFYLYKVRTDPEYFSVLEVLPTSLYLAEFFDFYSADIDRYFPGFAYRADPGDITVLVLRNMVPAGVFVGRPADSATLQIVIDYAIPRYADFKIGKYLFDTRADWFITRGWRTLQTSATTDAHRKYLLRMGFAPVAGGGYERRL